MVSIIDEAPSLSRRSAAVAFVEASVFLLWAAGTALSPVWFGSNTRPLWAAHALLFGLALALFAAARILVPRPLPVPLTLLALPLAAMAVVLGWALIQTIAGVPGVLQNPVWSNLSETLGKPVAGAISVAPEAGRVAVLWAGTAVAVFFLAVQLGRDPVRARNALYAITITAGVVAAYGLAIYFDGNRWVLWQPKRAYMDALTATFINKNNYAAFAGMGLVCAFGLLLDRLPHGLPHRTERRGALPARGVPHRVRRTRGAMVMRGLGILVLGASLAASGVALLLAGSRAGAAVTILGVTVVLVLWLARLPSWRRPLFLSFGLAAVGILVLASSYTGLLASRLPSLDQDLGTRLAVDVRVIAAIKAAPWTGYGLGAFQQAFAAFRDANLSSHGRWEYGHNDWLEALMTLGVPVGLMVWAVFAWIAARCVIGALTRGRDAVYPAIGAGVCALAFTHTLVDFTMQIQGFAFPFLAIVGIGVAQSWSSRGAAARSGQSALRRPTT